MRVVIDIPKEFARDYCADKFKDFFLRVIADIDNGGLICGNYEKEIAEMFLKSFGDSLLYERVNRCCLLDNGNTLHSF